MPQLFNIGIKGVIVKNNKALLLKRKNSLGVLYWDIPGGRINTGETIGETLKRELKEEINLEEFEIKELIHVYQLDRLLDGKYGHLLLFYRIKTSTDVEPILSKEHILHKWVGKYDLKKLDKTVKLEAHTKIILNKVLK